MTEKQLEQLPWMIRERNYQTKRAEELRSIVQPGRRDRGACFFGTSLSREERKALEKDAELMQRAESLPRAALEERLNQVEELYPFIYQVEDSQMRLILLARFVDGKTWQGVATAIGEYDESYVRKKCKRFLKSTERKEKVNDRKKQKPTQTNNCC